MDKQETKQEMREALDLFERLIKKLNRIADNCDELSLARLINTDWLKKVYNARKEMSRWYYENFDE